MKKEKPRFDEKKYIELCTKREMKMYELRKNGVPYTERLKAVLPISKEISRMTFGDIADEYEETFIELAKAKEDEDEEKEDYLYLRLKNLAEPPSDKEIPIFKLIDASGINGVPNLYVNGKEKFKRLMVKRIGYKRHIKNGIYEAVLFDEAPIEKGQIIYL